MNKIKVLGWFDYCCSTGFSTVSSNIWQRLYATGKYDLDVVGVNFTGDPYDRFEFPGNVYPAASMLNYQGNYADLYGRQRFLDMIGQGEYDVIFMIQDTFVLESMMEAIEDLQNRHPHPFKSIFYFPIDATPKDEWVTEVVSKIDYPVAYTRYGYDECVKIDPKLVNKLKVIYHGNDFNTFFHIEDRKEIADFRHHAYRGDADNKFLIVNVNRNQRRKDIARSFMVLKELYDRGHKDVILYMHMAYVDVGGNVVDIAKTLGFELNKDFLIPDNFNSHSGFPAKIVNYIYNSADCYLTTTHGEGWGLSVTEAMATKTPVVAPRNTSLEEILEDNRGFLVDCGNNPSMWIVKDQDNDRMRPLMDVQDAADKIIDIKQGIKPDLEAAYDWVHNYSWDNIAKEWERLIDEAYLTPKKQPTMAVPGKKKRKKK